MAIQVYSFLDVSATIQGPNGSFPLGVGAAAAEEGITIDYSIDSETMNIGADGTPMHSLHASKGGMISVKLQKTSPTNSNLMTMWKADRANGSQDWGQNTLTITNIANEKPNAIITREFFSHIPLLHLIAGVNNDFFRAIFFQCHWHKSIAK